jgi:ubiquinone/menaquinone biosynthesis C-methylase UbiE
MLLDRLPGPILNVGAGYTGLTTRGMDIINVDLVAPAVAGPLEAPFVVADGRALPFPDRHFQGVLLKDVLEHVVDSIGLLTEVRRVLAPGGRVTIITPRAIPRAVWDDPTHVRGFTARALRTAVETAGLQAAGDPRRIGALPGSGRLHLEDKLEQIMRIPGLGHWFGTNWVMDGCRDEN